MVARFGSSYDYGKELAWTTGTPPATKGDITDLDQKEQLRGEMNQKLELLRGEVNQNMEQLRSEMNQKLELLRGEVNHGYTDLAERMSDAETRLLKTFMLLPRATSIV